MWTIQEYKDQQVREGVVRHFRPDGSIGWAEYYHAHGVLSIFEAHDMTVEEHGEALQKVAEKVKQD